MKTIPAAVVTEKNKDEAIGILTFVDIYCDDETLHYVHNDINVSFFDPEGVAVTYTALRMSRERKEDSMDMTIQSFSAGLDNVDQAMGYIISQRQLRDKRIVIRSCFRNLITDADNAWKVFDGYIDNPQISKTEMRIELTPRLGRGTLNTKIGIRQQLLCRLPFAGTRCAYGTTAAMLKDEKTGQTVDSAAVGYIVDSARTEADDYWTCGYVIFASDTLTESLRGVSRMIQDFSQSEHKVTFMVAFPVAPQAGDTYSIERGCDLTLASCQDKFSNELNFGGIHTLPAQMVRK